MILEPPIAEAAARRRTEADLALITAAAANFAAKNVDTASASFHATEFFRTVGAATHNRILMMGHEPLLQLLDSSLRAMMDEVPQSRGAYRYGGEAYSRRHSLEGCGSSA